MITKAELVEAVEGPWSKFLAKIKAELLSRAVAGQKLAALAVILNKKMLNT